MDMTALIVIMVLTYFSNYQFSNHRALMMALALTIWGNAILNSNRSEETVFEFGVEKRCFQKVWSYEVIIIIMTLRSKCERFC